MKEKLEEMTLQELLKALADTTKNDKEHDKYEDEFFCRVNILKKCKTKVK